ncbi:MAG TPA: MlaD family protein [Burkholderiaceae bacterium]|jgi:phospholipid/cholesterol/gamma-HCH transport system substrate-binding protein|nr:MlaD family protein [Burkholderiaceae bacterium]
MENKAHALMAGVFTLLLLIAAILIALWFNRDKGGQIPYEMATKLSIPGLNPQAAVRYRGLDVGRVNAINFDPKVPGQILVLLSVKPDTPITKSTYGSLGYQGVTGIAYVQLDDDGSNPVRLPSSKDDIARIEMRASLFDKLQTSGLAILEKTDELVKRFNTLMAPDNQKAIMAAVDNVSRAAQEIEAIPRQLEPTLKQLPTLTSEASLTLSSIKKLSSDASALSNNLNKLTTQLQAPDGAVTKLAIAADQVGAVAEKIEDQALPLTHDVQTSMRSLDRTLDRLNERPQSILFGSSVTPGPGEPGFNAPSH